MFVTKNVWQAIVTSGKAIMAKEIQNLNSVDDWDLST